MMKLIIINFPSLLRCLSCYLGVVRSCSSSSIFDNFASAPALCPALLLLKKCKSLLQADLVQQQAIVHGLLVEFSVSLVSTYVTLAAPHQALSLLQRLTPSSTSVFCWNTLIRSSVHLGMLDCALSLHRKMLMLGWSADHYTFPLVLKACGEMLFFRLGGSVHAVVCGSGFESNVYVCNALVAMYGRCGKLDDAHQMFVQMCGAGICDLVSWNSIVTAHVQCGSVKNAVSLFDSMCKLGLADIRPDAVSLVNLLPALASTGAWCRGKQVHAFAMRSGLSEVVCVANSLVDMYAKCKKMDEADRVFRGIARKDVVSWNAMVSGYCQIGRFEDAFCMFEKMREQKMALDVVSWSAVIAGFAQRGLGCEALDVFRKMQDSGSKPNEVTIISVLSGCASIGALLHGKEIHCHAAKSIAASGGIEGEKYIMVANALVDMYAKSGSVNLARTVFDFVAEDGRDVVTWTAIIGGYAQHGDANDALELFSAMTKKDRPTMPNAFTISCALMACARLAALRSGRQIHAFALRNPRGLDTDFVANCLLDMYSKSGDVRAASSLFDRMKQRNAISWTSLMACYGLHGRGEEALEVFDGMKRLGFVPDGVTLLVVLYACSHSGMVERGLKYFDGMDEEFGVAPGDEHFACIVDLLGRAGRLNEALQLIRRMPTEPSPIVWVALLSGCRTHANVELGEYAASRLLQSESESDGSYTLLSNLYACAGRWKDVSRIRSVMKHTGVRKRPGCSWVEGRQGLASFFVGDRRHPLSTQIYQTLADLIQRIKLLGYVPQTSFSLHDVDEEEKGGLLLEHSEKLALVYGILTSVPGAPIRITKNLRACGDCHSAITYISMIVDHEIILRDSSRFHHFKQGSCSCRGYW